MPTKYHNIHTWSYSWGAWFDSGAEAKRGEELLLLERAGVIWGVKRQVKFTLCLKPRITITIDFSYMEAGKKVYEDSKGVLTRECRVKLAWLQEKHGIEVKLIRN